MKTTREWRMVVQLRQVKAQMNSENQRLFVESLYQLLDEFTPILEQQSADQVEYLYAIYKKYIGAIQD